MRLSLPHLRFLLVRPVVLAIAFLVGSPAIAVADDQGKPASIQITGDTPWIVAPDESGPVLRTLRDVQRDWYKVFGRPPLVYNELPAHWPGPTVFFGSAWQGDAKQPQAAECYRIFTSHEKQPRGALVATGSDMRGKIYAAYALSEHVLGVDPWYYWTDHEPTFRESIDLPTNLEIADGPPAFPYRGWFINDEDLLAGWKPDPLGENIFALTIWDRIYETILRLKGNMIVPGTFTFADETCRRLAHERGLIINDHHINVVGLNTFQWPNDIPYSYSQHPEILERMWKTTIDAMKDWEVIWTVGYRGKHDRPFWHDEKGVDSPEARGDLISRAIAKQVELVRDVQPDAQFISNLWGEGVELYKQGHLRLPDGITLVWPDNGHGMIRDKGEVQPGQGIYYHTMMLNGMANQLTEMVPPQRAFSEIGRFVQADATAFFLVNVSDIRPVPLSTDAVMKFVWDPKPFMDESPEVEHRSFLVDFSRRQFGDEVAESVAKLYADYFNIEYMNWGQFGEQRAMVLYAELIHPLWAEMHGTGSAEARKKLIEHAKTCRDYARKPLGQLADLEPRAERLLPSIPDERKQFYEFHVIGHIQTHRQIIRALDATAQAVLAYDEDDKDALLQHARENLAAWDKMVRIQRRSEYGKWRGFYFGEMFTFFHYQRDMARSLVDSLQGKPLLGLDPPPHYPKLYRYQEKAAESFPLFYPASRPAE